uniref:Ferritin n=1 Tax=Salmo salar TaxID=8030 RepID=C0H8N6_SALSA|nr:Ferritin, middle subunit [Salmo salar]ACN12770.1 Ferritin, middle subunit [Salmo salar]
MGLQEVTQMGVNLVRGNLVQVQQGLVHILLQLQSTLHGLQPGDNFVQKSWPTFLYKVVPGLEAMQCALQLEKNVNQALLDLHKIASDKVDPHLCDFLETHYLNEQVEAIKKLGDHITNLTKMDAVKNKMAEYLFDKHTLGGQS